MKEESSVKKFEEIIESAPCPYCDAAKGEPCFSGKAGLAKQPHRARLLLAMMKIEERAIERLHEEHPPVFYVHDQQKNELIGPLSKEEAEMTLEERPDPADSIFPRCTVIRGEVVKYERKAHLILE